LPPLVITAFVVFPIVLFLVLRPPSSTRTRAAGAPWLNLREILLPCLSSYFF